MLQQAKLPRARQQVFQRRGAALGRLPLPGARLFGAQGHGGGVRLVPGARGGGLGTGQRLAGGALLAARRLGVARHWRHVRGALGRAQPVPFRILRRHASVELREGRLGLVPRLQVRLLHLALAQ
ncbi:hypothetical protein D3C87_1320460 [compost metagenome]